MTGITNWVTWASVLSTSQTGIVFDAYTVVTGIKLGMVGAVVTVTIFWSVTVVGCHTVRMTLRLVNRAIFSTPVFITYTGVVFKMGVLHTLFAIVC